MEKNLYLFTYTYPYGFSENFLESEILFLSKKFDKIIILPFSGKFSNQRNVPKNCIVLDPVRKRRTQYLLGLFGSSFIAFAKDFFINKAYKRKKYIKKWLFSYIIVNMYLNSARFRTIINNAKSQDVLYFYWGIHGNEVFSQIFTNAKKVSRFHGDWDLWELDSGNYAPIRQSVLDSLDIAVFVSSKGEHYLRQHYEVNCNTYVARLGAFDNGVSLKSDDNIVRILSCSTVYPLKRVNLIFNAIQEISDFDVEWTHLGGGPDFSLLKDLANNSKKNIKVNLKGQIPSSEVIDYYKNNRVDVFINLSTNEGIPVSIMEAISFDVPIIATDVGGTSEIVNSRTGLLLPRNPTVQEIVDGIKGIVRSNLSPKEFWREYFNAKVNYDRFANLISNLEPNQKSSI